MLYPLTFQPILKERVWGGRNLEPHFGKPLPPTAPIGETWEISDRPGDVSVIANGPLAGRDLRWLMEHHRSELIGDSPAPQGRFPWLMKILDAREKLSVQVHPPAHRAAELSGEPKSELWYVAHAGPDAVLYAGLKRGVTRAEFERRLRDGTVPECVHRLAVKAGDALFLPSGRIHALGAGLVIFEIQQNSDTTYRVFDWNRAGADGQPRELHVPQSLASIDFEDFEPGLVPLEWTGGEQHRRRQLVRNSLFAVDEHHLAAGVILPATPHKLQVVAVVRGEIQTRDDRSSQSLTPGTFCLIPARSNPVRLHASKPSVFLRVEAETSPSATGVESSG